MSDDGHQVKRSSPNGSVSDHHEERSRSKEPSAPRSRSPSIHKPSSRRGKGYSRSRSRSRSYHKSYKKYRSRSRSRDKKYKSRYSHSRSHSRSRSGSYSPHSRRRDRSHSRSPMSNRRRHNGNRKEFKEERKSKYQELHDRENPQPSRCLGVFGLSIYTTEQQLHHIFSKYGPVERVQVVIDAKSGRSRGFCFVYFESHEDAKVAKEQCTGMEIDGRRIRVDYSITQRAHTPTPGIYMGKPTYSSNYDRYNYDDRGWGGRRDYGYNDYYGGGYRGSYRGRSPSPYYSRRRSRYDRSRSRSYSPRRY
ncbi:transformer-2 protein homolog alpha-like isoform X2 [Macrosteles quadrilineatus]|uniref:transformer-2 protein homolog alpha-like isoform X2 n=1 Tax=Macrosteles quadrilineatus TaxID=74068 RepID=UPI0023E25CF9|nr:transformer-2 protein homolog alpha-like isoform X2 [Macrosteles quadrilineatus]